MYFKLFFVTLVIWLLFMYLFSKQKQLKIAISNNCSDQEIREVNIAMDKLSDLCLNGRLCNTFDCKKRWCFIRKSNCRKTPIFNERYRQLKNLVKKTCGENFRRCE